MKIWARFRSSEYTQIYYGVKKKINIGRNMEELEGRKYGEGFNPNALYT